MIDILVAVLVLLGQAAVIGIVVYFILRKSKSSEEIYPNIDTKQDGGTIKIVDEGDTWKNAMWYIVGTGVVGFIVGIFVLMSLSSEANFVVWGFTLLSVLGFGYLSYVTITKILTVMKMEPGELRFETWPITWGKEVEAEFRRRLRGSVNVKSVTLELRCREVVKYQQGTDVRTVKTTVHSETIKTLDPGGRTNTEVSGSFTFTPSKDYLHSLDVYRNNVIWEIVADLDIETYPDDESVFEILVKPEGNHD
ncbi:MAG: hypothetical protein ABEJ65_09565 [bacterium]